MNWWNRKKVINALGVTEPVLTALTVSGLLGYTSPTVMFADHAVRSYQRFGTQWSLDGRFGPTVRMMGSEDYEKMPPIEGIGPQPPATPGHMFIWAEGQADGVESQKSDTGWIFQFYLVPNYFYFPSPFDVGLIGPPPLKLPGPKPVPGADLPVTLYPHPSGNLGLVVVEGLGRPVAKAHREAYDVAMPLLDELSARYDVPLPVAHSMAVGVPSGTIHLHFAQRPKVREIDPGAEILPKCPHPELRDAYALYREAISSNNPFHAFLAYWKVYEEAVYVRKGWGAKHRRRDTKVKEEVFPDLFAFGTRPEELADPSEHPGEDPEGQIRGERFERGKELLRGPYRVALAHAGKVDTGKPLTGATYGDYQKVLSKVPVVRYMANVVLENVRATFDAEAKIEAVMDGGRRGERRRVGDLEEPVEAAEGLFLHARHDVGVDVEGDLDRRMAERPGNGLLGHAYPSSASSHPSTNPSRYDLKPSSPKTSRISRCAKT